MDEEAPLSLTMKALVSKTGVLTVLAHADLLAKKPAFTGQAQLTGLELSTLHEWTKVRAGVSARGEVNVFANFNSAEGVLSGDVKVMLDGAKLEPATGQVDDLLKASFGQLAINVLGDNDKDSRIATTLPIRGELTEPSPQIWPTILGVVRNVLVEGVSWGFSDLPRPTAKEKRGPLEQATEALDPKGGRAEGGAAQVKVALASLLCLALCAGCPPPSARACAEEESGRAEALARPLG